MKKRPNQKFGTTEQRRHAAALARDIRAMWPGLHGNWTRREWNQQALYSAQNYLSNRVRFDRANKVEA